MLLSAIQRFKIEQMALVPPIMIHMLSSQAECAKYDISSVRFIFSGAAPLGKETMEDLLKVWPKWNICQGYGKRVLVLIVFLMTDSAKASPRRLLSSHPPASWTSTLAPRVLSSPASRPSSSTPTGVKSPSTTSPVNSSSRARQSSWAISTTPRRLPRPLCTTKMGAGCAPATRFSSASHPRATSTLSLWTVSRNSSKSRYAH